MKNSSALKSAENRCREYSQGLLNDYCLNCGGTLFSHYEPMTIVQPVQLTDGDYGDAEHSLNGGDCG